MGGQPQEHNLIGNKIKIMVTTWTSQIKILVRSKDTNEKGAAGGKRLDISNKSVTTAVTDDWKVCF